MSKADPVDVAKAVKKAGDKTLSRTTTVKFSRFVREYVTLKAAWNESIDSTLRRLLGLPPQEEA